MRGVESKSIKMVTERLTFLVMEINQCKKEII